MTDWNYGDILEAVAARVPERPCQKVNADGSLHLLGRGSVCINTGGEKVFPEEVFEALRTHPSVRDAVAVGVPACSWNKRLGGG